MKSVKFGISALVVLSVTTIAHASPNSTAAPRAISQASPDNAPKDEGPLSDLIPYPFHAVQAQGQNKIEFVDDSIEAFQIRLDMIRRAKTSIEAEYFILNLDTAGRIFVKELARAASRGVRVRLLIDKSMPVYQFNEYYAKELAARGVDIRYYNGAAIWQVSTEQFRDHRKLLVIDDSEAITGGRNIADEYFDLSPTFNFNDADVYVVGPMTKVMRETFDRYYTNHLARTPYYPSEPEDESFVDLYKERTAKAKAFLDDTTPEEIAARRRLAAAASEGPRHQLHTCPTMTFATDAPGADFLARIQPDYHDEYRFLRKTLFDKISNVDQRLVIVSPYVIDTRPADSLLDGVLARGGKVEVYTNSLGSTDASYVAANMYLGLKRWVKEGVAVYLHDGHWVSKNQETPDFIRQSKAGLHSKVQVYFRSTGSEAMVGTYNVDHRSAFYNAEMGTFCAGSDAFTNDVVRSIEHDRVQGMRVNPDAESVTARDGSTGSIYGATEGEILKMELLTPVFWLVRDLL